MSLIKKTKTHSKEVSLWLRKAAVVKEAVKVEKGNRYLAHYGIKGMKWDLSKRKNELEEEKEAFRQRKAEQTANRKSTKGMTKAQREEYRAEREAQRAANQETQATLQAKRDEIAELSKKIMKAKRESEIRKRNVERQRQRAKTVMKKFGATKIRIV